MGEDKCDSDDGKDKRLRKDEDEPLTTLLVTLQRPERRVRHSPKKELKVRVLLTPHDSQLELSQPGKPIHLTFCARLLLLYRIHVDFVRNSTSARRINLRKQEPA